MAATDSARSGRSLSGFLGSPLIGMSPWIAFSILVGPGRFEWAVGAALVISLALVIGGRVAARGSSVKILEVSDLVFFAIMAVVGAVASPGTHRWLETYAGEISNLALVAIAFGSMALRVPFTIQYAREQVPPAYWTTPTFLRTNYLITAAWGVAFLVAAIAGGYGDLVLHNPNNIWTGWIIQILAIVAALRFTVWYPEVVRARARGDRPVPSAADLLLPLAGMLVPVGIAVLVFDGDMWWLGVGLIVIGGWLTRRLKHRVDSETPATRRDFDAPA
ncbi:MULTISPECIES: hypothetical protein [unclassified Streptomyces]|uniref:hypothetical protein n=1 Tax=unclassified Streptomyces TaxID=2593676 RepID=UPI00109E7C33|nr:hypothetical protein [Streptomyces sp. A1136]THA57852.1 hypothetical protein E6R62_05000 [Streptomyces sp. A1136]